MKVPFYIFCLLSLIVFPEIAVAIELTLPTGGSDKFSGWTTMMQDIINFMGGPWSLFVSLIMFIGWIVGYYLDPRSAFIQGFLKIGFVVIGVFAAFSVILNIHKSF